MIIFINFPSWFILIATFHVFDLPKDKTEARMFQQFSSFFTVYPGCKTTGSETLAITDIYINSYI